MDFEAKAIDLEKTIFHGKFKFAAFVPEITAALKEAYDQGAKSEAVMWELQRLGQEMDID